MKSKLLSILGLLCTVATLAQTDDWYLLTKVSEITKIIPDDVSTNELHLATDIGYIKYNTSTNSVTDFLNLTSQNPAIAKVKDVALDPTSNDIAFTLMDGIGIYDGNTITTYSYDGSDLTIGQSTSQFLYLQVEYAKDGSLYIYKEDALGYQIFDSGIFETEEVTPFRPQDIIENNTGTKAYFAGDNNGLWELEKGTMTWTNFTISNSDLVSNALTSFHIDQNDLLHIGSFQGISTLNSLGVWNTYQMLEPVNNIQYYSAFEISKDETTGDLLVRTSSPSLNYFGLSIVDLDTNTWTNYREDNLNCLNENLYTATAFGGNGNVYAAPQIFSSITDVGKLVEFTPSTESCSITNINYLNAPVAINSNVVSDFSIRKKTNGNLDIGFTRTFDFHLTEINPINFNGVFSTATTLTPSPGNFIGNIISDNDKFIIDTNTGWLVYDETNNETVLNHNLPDYLSIVTKKANVGDSDNGIVTLVHKGFDADFNYRVYKTQCDIGGGICSASEEIFTNDRDHTKDVNFGCVEDVANDQIIAVGVKTNSSGEIKRTKETWVQSLNGPPILIWEEGHPLYPFLDILIVAASVLGDETSSYVNDENTIQVRTEDTDSANPIITNIKLDENNDGNLDKVVHINRPTFSNGETNDIATIIVAFISNGFEGVGLKTLYYGEISPTISGAEINNGLPQDFRVQKHELLEYNSNEGILVLLTNYGLLVKNAIDISNITLSDYESIKSTSPIYLYPNPSKSIVTFSDNSIISSTVFDLNGRHILNSSSNTFSVESLAKGIYVVKGKTIYGKEVVKKFIKN